jgi:hypothetical protein
LDAGCRTHLIAHSFAERPQAVFPASDRYAQPDSPLARVLQEAAYYPSCSSDKTATLVRPAAYAVRYPYMQVNRPDMISWLVFDLDHDNPLIWEQTGLPAPNMTVINRRNGYAHLFYAITPVCISEKARAKPIQYLKAIYKAMALRLNADPAYACPVAKTPGHPWWKTCELHNQVYSLNELADYVEFDKSSPWRRPSDLDSVSHSRHCLLFEELRHYAYSIVNHCREQGRYQSFVRQLEDFAASRNNYRHRGVLSNLTLAQVKATVRSVSRWTWERYRGTSKCHRGVMGLSRQKHLTLSEKQSLAAARTHQTRTEKTSQKIKAAVANLIACCHKVTQSAVARIAGVSRQTVARYLQTTIEKRVQNENEATNQLKQSSSNKDVKYAVHQISVLSEKYCIVRNVIGVQTFSLKVSLCFSPSYVFTSFEDG